MFFPPCSCFISDNRIRYGIFLVPLFSILVFNVVVFVMVARVLINHYKKKSEKVKDNQGKMGNTLKILISIASVMVMFGLSWLFGALSVDKAAIVFQWFFVLFSTSQGFLLFIFFCVISKDAREEWKMLLTLYRYKGKKKGSAIPSSTAKQTRTYGSKDTILTSKVGSSETTSQWLQQKGVKSDSHSKTIDLEMAEFGTDVMKKDLYMDTKDTQMLINHDSAKETDSNPKVENTDSQVPPQILFRLKRPYYDLVLDKSSPSISSSSEFGTFTTGIDIDEYREHHSGYEESDIDSAHAFTEL